MLMEKQKITFTRNPYTIDNYRKESCPCPAVNVPVEATLIKIMEKIYINERKVKEAS